MRFSSRWGRRGSRVSSLTASAIVYNSAIAFIDFGPSGRNMLPKIRLESWAVRQSFIPSFRVRRNAGEGHVLGGGCVCVSLCTLVRCELHVLRGWSVVGALSCVSLYALNVYACSGILCTVLFSSAVFFYWCGHPDPFIHGSRLWANEPSIHSSHCCINLNSIKLFLLHMAICLFTLNMLDCCNYLQKNTFSFEMNQPNCAQWHSRHIGLGELTEQVVYCP